jgi:hypothetical protein
LLSSTSLAAARRAIPTNLPEGWSSKSIAPGYIFAFCSLFCQAGFLADCR